MAASNRCLSEADMGGAGTPAACARAASTHCTARRLSQAVSAEGVLMEAAYSRRRLMTPVNRSRACLCFEAHDGVGRVRLCV